MLTTRRLVVLAGAVCLVLAGFTIAAFAAGGTPADKVTAAGDHAEVMAPQSNTVLLSATMSTSKPTDLILTVSLHCSILTTVNNTGTSTATAAGSVRVWTEVDGKIVPVESTSTPPQDTPPGGDDTDK